MADTVKGFTVEALHAMRCYDWPGNVRELINRIRRAMVMSENHLVTAADLGLKSVRMNIDAVSKQIVTLDEAKALAEKEAIENALSLSESNVSSRCAPTQDFPYDALPAHGEISDQGRLSHPTAADSNLGYGGFDT
ncbi:MAG: hypothetical protein MZV65_28895 [Chromatiales bacterium]|nr:hypothetical protein [Chromatiales bacterium]